MLFSGWSLLVVAVAIVVLFGSRWWRGPWQHLRQSGRILTAEMRTSDRDDAPSAARTDVVRGSATTPESSPPEAPGPKASDPPGSRPRRTP